MIRLLLLSSLIFLPACTLAPTILPASPPQPSDLTDKPFTMAGFQFANVEWKEFYPVNLKIAKYEGELVKSPINLEQNEPQITTPPNKVTLDLNAAINEFAFDIWGQIDGPSRSQPNDDKPADLSLDYAPNLDALTGIISIKFSEHDYQPGPGHEGSVYVVDFNWVIAKGSEFRPEYLFKDNSKWRAIFADAG